jgi:hypothetical protein
VDYSRFHVIIPFDKVLKAHDFYDLPALGQQEKGIAK